MYTEGAEVIMACRDETKAVQVVDDIKKSLSSACKVSFMKLDLASLQSVRDFAAAFAASKLWFNVFFIAIAISLIFDLLAAFFQLIQIALSYLQKFSDRSDKSAKKNASDHSDVWPRPYYSQCS